MEANPLVPDSIDNAKNTIIRIEQENIGWTPSMSQAFPLMRKNPTHVEMGTNGVILHYGNEKKSGQMLLPFTDHEQGIHHLSDMEHKCLIASLVFAYEDSMGKYFYFSKRRFADLFYDPYNDPKTNRTIHQPKNLQTISKSMNHLYNLRFSFVHGSGRGEDKKIVVKNESIFIFKNEMESKKLGNDQRKCQYKKIYIIDSFQKEFQNRFLSLLDKRIFKVNASRYPYAFPLYMYISLRYAVDRQFQDNSYFRIGFFDLLDWSGINRDRHRQQQKEVVSKTLTFLQNNGYISGFGLSGDVYFVALHREAVLSKKIPKSLASTSTHSKKNEKK
jgi:hypothetical protein